MSHSNEERSNGLTANFVKNANGTYTGKICEISAVGTVTGPDLGTTRSLLLGKLWINEGLVVKAFYA